MYRILFVCTGNICRSPTAEGIARELLDRAGLSAHYQVDSAGTYSGHAGEPPDVSARMAAKRRGYRLDDLRARAFEDADFGRFDLILGMDRGHLHELRIRAPIDCRDRVRLFNDMSRSNQGKDVPDPYGKEADIYETALEMIDTGCKDLVDALVEHRPDRV